MKIVIADKSHAVYASLISDTIAESAKVRGTGIAKRTPEYIITKMENGNAVIALDGDKFVGFCYIEAWSHGKFVANSGLIVHPDYRGAGVAKQIKHKIFEHSRKKYPDAKVFSITTGLAVMKMNTELGYRPVPFSELTDDPTFWKGCQTCKNYDVLQRTEQKMCLCTGMLYNPEIEKKGGKINVKPVKEKVFKRLKQIKETLYLKKEKNEK
ncbi:GNAT family N-acetyltransferase [Mangrovimonas sp. AS39]|uniref:GNAT family N-acetyltransferase n=1 Tax=Mangrovimonas TaxID=1211036 RepID=UPI0014226792|nr:MULTISPECIES: GNAT family N-acetyltransferase [Mangrovimonas]MCF1192388.1 GNAT family N-acetyltransferase [Mangrovimonas futianensis]MCF1196282.1 GNAT family N-acetyltransferase [Mangrovimonas futianensis]MCF1422643.1 GNAT family N-acetyltransferase [Mangrovimonas futianensis]NIK92979.1 GNAT family N-acetyltransferase [Mangrovimonas sp. CR14]